MKQGVIRCMCLALCVVVAASDAGAAEGKLRDGRYTSPWNNFALRVPAAVSVPVTGPLMKIQDSKEKDGGSVVFVDDFDNMNSIHYVRLTPKILQSLREDAAFRKTMLESFLKEYAMANVFRRVSSKPEIRREQWVTVDGDDALVALLDLPGGSTFVNAKTKQRLDVTQGAMILSKGEYVYMFGYHNSPMPAGEPAGADTVPTDTLLESLTKSLEYFYRSVFFTDSVTVAGYRAAADRGEARPAYSLGEMYARGEGVPQDYKEAVKWYRTAAERSWAPAQNNLGNLYSRGLGVRQDSAEAAKWTRLAAEQGLAFAQSNLGHMFHEGRGVSRDPIEAYTWLSLAAAKGVRNADRTLEELKKQMTPDQIAEGIRRAQEFVPRKVP